MSMERSKGEGTRKEEKGKERRNNTKEFLRRFSGKVNQDQKYCSPTPLHTEVLFLEKIIYVCA